MFVLHSLICVAVACKVATAFPTYKDDDCDQWDNDVYDYIVVGGGTTGLAVAGRLSEDPNLKIAVIEAGDSVYNNPNVTNVYTFGLPLGTQVDWQYQSTPQKFGNGRVQPIPQGKALGGSSAINGWAYIRPEQTQLDSWETIGNKGLNWKSVFPYFLKSENFTRPTPLQLESGVSYDPSLHGYSGPVNVGWQTRTNGTAFFNALQPTWEKLGIPLNKDVNSGKIRGFGPAPLTIDATRDIREDSARAYLWPVLQSRPNYHVFVNTLALRLSWDKKTPYGKKPRANGVEVQRANGKRHVIKVRKEVVVSLGAIRTPSFLEYSGVGNPKILSKYNVPVKVDLPRVGENLLDHPAVIVNVTLNQKLNERPQMYTFPSAKDLFGSSLPSVRKNLLSSLPKYAQLIADNASNSTTAETQLKLLKTQFATMFDNPEPLPLSEMYQLQFPAGFYIAVIWILNPFSRGSVHISSADMTAYPTFDPNYFSTDFDFVQETASLKLWRAATRTSPLRDVLSTELSPGYENVPLDASDAQWETWLRANFFANNHPIGTAAMMDRELGGVVDERHRLYGVQNVRVADASVFPFQICGHPTSLLYALAERLADFIKRGL